MITREESKKLKKTIGFPHISQVSARLQEKGLLNRYGRPYSQIFISSVFNGKIEHLDLEEVIWELAKEKIAYQKETEARQEEIKKELNKRMNDEQ